MHPTRLLFEKISLAAAPFIILAGVFVYLSPVPSASQQLIMQEKIDTFAKSLPERSIVISGDSRAKHDLVPEVFGKQSGIDVANVAVGGAGLSMVYDELSSNRLLHPTSIIILSTTIYEINDGYLNYDPATLSVIKRESLNMHTVQDSIAYALMLGEYYTSQFKQFLRHGNAQYSNELGNAGGYIPDTDRIQVPMLPSADADGGWYRDFKTDIKLSLFTQAIDRFAASGATIVIYKAPYAPAWQAIWPGSHIQENEERFSAILRSEASKYPNVYFFDFSTSTPLTDADFADDVHLNEKGAPIFTDLFVKRLKELSILNHGVNTP